MEIGVDASGKFLTGQRYEPTVVAAAVGAESTFTEIGEWTREALQRWNLADKHVELHAKKLRGPEIRQVCEMLAERGDVRLAVLPSELVNAADGWPVAEAGVGSAAVVVAQKR